MEKENIELRSEKVRGIIGEIPHAIVRVGISVLFFVMLLLLFICYFIKVPTLIECDVKARHGNKLMITADEMRDIPVGSSYQLKYNNAVIYTDTIKCTENTTSIDQGKVIYSIVMSLPDTIRFEGRNIVINDYSSLKATIKTSDQRLLHKYFPFLGKN